MLKQSLPAIALLISIGPGWAQGFNIFFGNSGTNSAGSPGTQMHVSQPTGVDSPRQIKTTRKPQLPRASSGMLSPQLGGPGLPPTCLDSFVREAGGNASNIYGDEGTTKEPPLNNFTRNNRIDAGILNNNAGLTTGHESSLPSAWGGDEFVKNEGTMVSGDHALRGTNGNVTGVYNPGNGLAGASPSGGSYNPNNQFVNADGGGSSTPATASPATPPNNNPPAEDNTAPVGPNNQLPPSPATPPSNNPPAEDNTAPVGPNN